MTVPPPDPATPPPVDGTKDDWRAWVRAERRARVPDRDRVADGAALAAEVLALVDELGVAPGATVAAYEALPTEPPTAATITALMARGYAVIVPITMTDLDLDWCDPDGDRHALGTCAVSEAAVVLVPASGVDAAMTRLGKGGGSYDRALPRTTGTVVALVWPWEVHAGTALPAEPHDRPVDRVLTP